MSQWVVMTRTVMFLVVAILLPVSVLAQSTIAGTVRDTSGAVLPGVTVEASSPALIEKVRSVITDAGGLYRVIDLRPGTYAVTFSLPGFSTVRREGIVLETNFTANVSVDLRVGTLEETVTVSGATPVVDIQRTERATVMNRELLEAIPSARSLYTNTVPAIVRAVDVGGSGAMVHTNTTVYGSNEGLANEILVDGMSMVAGAGYPGVYYNFDTLEEVVYQVGGGTAEATNSGVIVNMIPRQGGNQFKGDATILSAGHRTQSANFTDELRKAGLTSTGGVDEIYDLNVSLGGPIKRDKVWFFTSGRRWKTDSYIADAFNPNGSMAIDDYLLYNITNRVTYQITPKNKLSGMYDISRKNQGHRGFGVGFSPEAAYQSWTPAPPSGNSILKYTSTVSNKLLVESAFSTQVFKFIGVYLPEVKGPSTTNPYGDIAKRDLITNRTWNAAPGGETYLRTLMYHFDNAVTYVTGSHSFKIGQQFGSGYASAGTVTQHGSLVQQYRNGVPDSVVAYNTPTNVRTDLNLQLAFFAQDSWTIKRLTLNPGIRYDIHRNSIPAQTAGAGRFVPARNFAAIPNIIDWKNVSPRVGGAYDLFGNGKTAVKASIGKYPWFDHTETAARYNPMTATGGTGSAVTDTRTWDDRNRNDIAEDNELGPSTNNRFGLGLDRYVDPDLERPFSWVSSVGFQQELRQGLGLSIAYNRRSYRNLIWTDNTETTHADYTLITIPDPRGSGQTLPVYNLNVNKRGQVNNLDRNSDQNTRFYNGVDVALNSRFRNGSITVSTSTGKIEDVTCEVDDPNARRFCDETKVDMPFLTSFRTVGAYLLPHGFRVAGVFQITPGGVGGQPIHPISYIVNRTIVPTLTNASVTVRLDEPGSVKYPHIQQLDFSIGKEFRTGRLQVLPKLEVANAFNLSTVLAEVTTFGSSLGRPQRILPGRLARLNLVVRF